MFAIAEVSGGIVMALVAVLITKERWFNRIVTPFGPVGDRVKYNVGYVGMRVGIPVILMLWAVLIVLDGLSRF